MRFECCKQNFRFINIDKGEIEKETEYELPEYRSNIQKILTSNSEIKINEKEFRNGEIFISGEIIWRILYITQPDNKIKNLTFFEDFEKQIPVKNPLFDEEDETKIFVRACPVNFSTKLLGQRKIFARSKFLVICDMVQYDIEQNDEENEEIPAEIQIKKKQLECADIEYSGKENIDISMEINIDSDMPEIKEILSSHSNVCVSDVVIHENRVVLKCELYISCLYEAESENASDYVSYEKSVPFEREVYIDADEYSVVYPEYELTKLNISVENDDYSERRVLKVSADMETSLAVISKKNCIITTDIYSTDYAIIPEKKQGNIMNFLDTYCAENTVQERVRTDLRGISDILYSSADLVFSNPEFETDLVYVNARGTLRIIGAKENGELEGVSANVSIKIPIKSIPISYNAKKIIWINSFSLASHECRIVNGEITFSACVCGSVVAFEEFIEDVIVGYTKSEEDPLLKCNGFTLYYPECGESVWDVAKNHMVNIERFITENNISGEIFDGKTAVLLH